MDDYGWDLTHQIFVPFLAPVLYCCHSASASGVVPKNSPTHSNSCSKQKTSASQKMLEGSFWDPTCPPLCVGTLLWHRLTSNCPVFFWMACTRLNTALSLPSTSPHANLQTHSMIFFFFLEPVHNKTVFYFYFILSWVSASWQFVHKYLPNMNF